MIGVLMIVRERLRHQQTENLSNQNVNWNGFLKLEKDIVSACPRLTLAYPSYISLALATVAVLKALSFLVFIVC